MSNLRVPDDDGEMSPLGADHSTTINLLPSGMRRAVGFLWSLNQHLLPTPHPLVQRFLVWSKHEELTPAEAKAAIAHLCESETAAKHRFAADLLCDLAAVVAQIVRRRQATDRLKEERQKDQTAAGDALPRDEQAALLKRTAPEVDWLLKLPQAERRVALNLPPLSPPTV